MSAHNPDQDDFDPALEQGAEDFGYEEESFAEGEGFAEEAYAEESFGEEEFAEDESWDENFDDGANADQAPADASPKKKGGLFNMALIALAVLGGGGFIYLKALAPQNTAQPQIADAQIPAEQSAEQSPEQSGAAQQQAALTQPTPIENGPLTPEPVIAPAPATDNLAPVNNDGALPTLAAPDAPATPPALTDAPVSDPVTAPADTLALTPEVTAEPAPSADMAAQPAAPVTPSAEQPIEVTSAPPMPAPIAAADSANGFNAGLPSARDIMIAAPGAPPTPTTAETATAAATTTAEPAAPAGISADAAKSIEQKLSVLITRLDTFESRIANLESGLHQVSGKISTLESKPAAAPNLEGVNNAIKALEEKMNTLQQAPAAKAAEPAPASVETPVAAPADVSKIDKPTFVPAAPEPKSEATPEASAPAVSVADTPKVEAAKPAVKAPSAAPARAAGWILRSAQPGTAMVVAKTGGEMRTVRVGDTLSGLGRITAIEQRGSKWVVQGTQGTLTH